MYRGKDSTYKTLQTMCKARAWPQQCWKSCANGSNIVALRFGDHGAEEMLGVVGSKLWPVSNFEQQLPTTRNNMQQGAETDEWKDDGMNPKLIKKLSCGAEFYVTIT